MKSSPKIDYRRIKEGTASKVAEENVYYVADGSPKSKLLLVRRKDWESIHKKYRKLQKKMELFDAISLGIGQVKRARKKGKDIQLLSDFLNEG